ncbi:MAG TPA: inositol monophosphatase family protein [Kofleriaceae bacterium]|nr:inositol monophosphatase family protein [Kofleriaceae bacterium]
MSNGPGRGELAEMLAVARSIAAEAGALIRAGWRTAGTVHQKGPVDLVTEYDLRCEELVRGRLGREFPDHEIVGEEGGRSGAAAPAEAAELVWYVDPIDGTTNFAHGHPFFAVSIGLCHRGRPVVGVVLAPAIGTEWCAAHGLGATRDGATCRVSTTEHLVQSLAATSFPYDKPAGEKSNFRQFEAFYRRTRGVRRCGAAALDFAMTADGTYGFYWGYDLGPWDACAGAILVEEAGGRVTDVVGGELRPPGGAVLATNGLMHEAALELLAEVRAIGAR